MTRGHLTEIIEAIFQTFSFPKQHFFSWISTFDRSGDVQRRGFAWKYTIPFLNFLRFSWNLQLEHFGWHSAEPICSPTFRRSTPVLSHDLFSLKVELTTTHNRVDFQAWWQSFLSSGWKKALVWRILAISENLDICPDRDVRILKSVAVFSLSMAQVSSPKSAKEQGNVYFNLDR